VDVVFDFYSGAPFYYKSLGQDKVKYMMFADNGVDVYSNALVVTDKYAKENGTLIKRFVRASLKGWEFTLKNPEEAIDILAKYRTEIDKPLMLANLKLIIDLWRTDRYKKQRPRLGGRQEDDGFHQDHFPVPGHQSEHEVPATSTPMNS